MSESLLTVKQLANRFGVCTMTVYRMIKENEIPSQKIRGQWRFDWSEVQVSLKNKNTSRIPRSKNLTEKTSATSA